MGGDSWGAALLESEVQGDLRKLRRQKQKQKQKARQRSKTPERLAAKSLKRRAPNGAASREAAQGSRPGCAASARVDPWRRK